MLRLLLGFLMVAWRVRVTESVVSVAASLRTSNGPFRSLLKVEASMSAKKSKSDKSKKSMMSDDYTHPQPSPPMSKGSSNIFEDSYVSFVSTLVAQSFVVKPSDCVQCLCVVRRYLGRDLIP